jgi:hypothetical protein
MLKEQDLVDTKTLKVSLKTYNWLARESKEYNDSMDKIISRLIEEIEEYRKSSKTKR